MRKFLLAAICTAVLLPGAGLAEVAGPKVSITTIEQLPTPLPLPYDEKADADAAVAAAITAAKESGKRVLIDLGGNWCGDCRVLSGIVELPEVKAFVEANYEVVAVDVGRMNKNLQIPERYGIKKLAGVPTVLIVDGDGTLVNSANAAELADARHMTPQAIVDWLAKWAKPRS